jgi:hypothetical protein
MPCEESVEDQGPFDFALVGIVEKPCKDYINRISSQEDPQSAAEAAEGIDSSSDENAHAAASSKKRVRRTVKPTAKGPTNLLLLLPRPPKQLISLRHCQAFQKTLVPCGPRAHSYWG